MKDTMLGDLRVELLLESLREVSRNRVPGIVVECGVWNGGAAYALAREMMLIGDPRPLYLFDTYAGSPPPTAEDGEMGQRRFEKGYFCVGRLEIVHGNLGSLGYPQDIYYVVGPVERTLRQWAARSIALAHFDTDWYSSTKAQLDYLMPHLAPGGIMMEDDYSEAYPGCKMAHDEYFGLPLPSKVEILDRTVLKWRQPCHS